MATQSERCKWIAQWIPQFRNYVSHEDRRVSEQAFREYLLERISWYEKRLLEVSGEPFMVQSPKALSAFSAVRGRLLDLGDQIRCAPYTFGEFMSAPSITSDEAEAFYERDQEVLRRLAALQSLMEPTLSEDTDAMNLARSMGGMIDELGMVLQARQAGINDYTPSWPSKL